MISNDNKIIITTKTITNRYVGYQRVKLASSIHLITDDNKCLTKTITNDNKTKANDNITKTITITNNDKVGYQRVTLAWSELGCLR